MMQPLNRLSLLFTDLDGTLLNAEESVSPSVVTQLRNARARGVAIVPATARGINGVRNVAKVAGLGPLAVCHNGAVGYHLDLDALLWVRELPSGFVRSAIEQLLHHDTGFYFAASTVTQFWPQRDFLKVHPLAPIEYELDQLFEVEPAVRLICRHPDVHADELAPIIRQVLADVQLISGSTDWVEIVPRGVNKGFGIGLAAEILGVPLEDCVAVGDHLNDLPMLTIVGHPFAVTNAHPAIFSTGAKLVPSNNEGGVGELAAQMGLSQRP